MLRVVHDGSEQFLLSERGPLLRPNGPMFTPNLIGDLVSDLELCGARKEV